MREYSIREYEDAGMSAGDEDRGDETYMEPMSDCCFAPIKWGDVCSRCLEHCGVADEE